MNQQIRIINHPLGYQIETPVLVPSYSSKGFAIIESDGKEKSEVSDVMINCAQFLTEITLVSAYDLYYKLIPSPEDFATTETIIIDSGGYETSDHFDFSTVKKFSNGNKEWKLEYYEEVLNNWPQEYPTIIVSFDQDYRGKSFSEQVSLSTKLFHKYPNSTNDFLIKPFTKGARYLDIKELTNNIHLLRGFDIIGVTEVELGNSILKRMKNIQLIRSSMNEAGINTPIHIFGSLDPITSILYFLSGADIFDGLTWIRYAYYNGVAIYPSNFSFLDEKGGISLLNHQVQTIQLFNNLASLQKLKLLLQKFVNTKEFEIFDSIGIPNFSQQLKEAFKNLK